MTDLTSFLPAEFTEIGLAAALDPHFAESFVEALLRLPGEPAAEPAVSVESRRPEEQQA